MFRNRGKKSRIKKAVVLIGSIFLLGGCGARELESRRFPTVLEIQTKEDQLLFACAWPAQKQEGGKTSEQTLSGEHTQKEENNAAGQENQLVNNEQITRVSGASMQEVLDQMQSLQEKYVDYSQVKAIIWGKDLVKKSQLYEEVTQWLEENPQFAGNILVFQGKTQDVSLETIQEKAQGKPGFYLENLYKNNAEFQKYTKTLKEILFF